MLSLLFSSRSTSRASLALPWLGCLALGIYFAWADQSLEISVPLPKFEIRQEAKETVTNPPVAVIEPVEKAPVIAVSRKRRVPTIKLQPILIAPRLVAPKDEFEIEVPFRGKEIGFRWTDTRVRQAETGFRWELAGDPSFGKSLLSFTTRALKFSKADWDLSAGTYYWRVVLVDGQGTRLTESKIKRLVVKERKLPSAPVSNVKVSPSAPKPPPPPGGTSVKVQ